MGGRGFHPEERDVKGGIRLAAMGDKIVQLSNAFVSDCVTQSGGSEYLWKSSLSPADITKEGVCSVSTKHVPRQKSSG
jgi:hypothetical protein